MVPILLPTLTKYHNNDPNLCNLLSSDRTINKMMFAALWKKKKKSTCILVYSVLFLNAQSTATYKIHSKGMIQTVKCKFMNISV